MKNKSWLVLACIGMAAPLCGAEKLIDDFRSPSFSCPMGGRWHAESDAGTGGSSRGKLVWVRKAARRKAPVQEAEKEKKNKRKAKQKEKADGFLRLEFQLKTNPQVSRPDAGPLLLFGRAADFSGWDGISLTFKLQMAEGRCLGMVLAEVMDEATGLWKPVAHPLELGSGGTMRAILRLDAFRTMKWWGKLHTEHNKRLNWSRVRSLQVLLLSTRPCEGQLTIDKIKLVDGSG